MFSLIFLIVDGYPRETMVTWVYSIDMGNVVEFFEKTEKTLLSQALKGQA